MPSNLSQCKYCRGEVLRFKPARMSDLPWYLKFLAFGILDPNPLHLYRI